MRPLFPSCRGVLDGLAVVLALVLGEGLGMGWGWRLGFGPLRPLRCYLGLPPHLERVLRTVTPATPTVTYLMVGGGGVNMPHASHEGMSS